MAYEFKKLSEVEALDAVPEGASVLAEVGGEIKRVPGEGLGGSGTIPEFDLAAMGLPNVPLDGTQVSVECDLTEIKNAMSKGLIKLKSNFDMASTVVPMEAIGVPIYNPMIDGYACSFIAYIDGPIIAYYDVADGKIAARIIVLATN